MASTGKCRKARHCRIALGAELVIGSAPALHAQLREALVEPLPVVLDAAAVTRLDTAGLQLLHAFVQARSEARAEWRWESVGSGLREAASRLGLESMLQLPDATPVDH